MDLRHLLPLLLLLLASGPAALWVTTGLWRSFFTSSMKPGMVAVKIAPGPKVVADYGSLPSRDPGV